MKRNKMVFKGVSIILCIILTLCPLSFAFATDPTPTPGPIDDIPVSASDLHRELVYYYIWLYLQSIGIDIKYGDIEAFTGEINDWIDEQLLEWASQAPSFRSIDILITPWKFFWNPSGNLIGNQSFLDDITDFTEWLIDIWDLDDNENVPTSSVGYTIDEVVVYSLPAILPYSDGHLSQNYVIYQGSDIYYTFTSNENLTYNSLYFISRGPGVVSRYQVITNGTTSGPYNTTLESYQNGWYSKRASPSLERADYGLDAYPWYTLATVQSALQNNNTITSYGGGGVYILTNTIDAPTTQEADGTNSIIITPGGNLYEPVDWDGTVTVNNLPAIVSTGRINNLDVSSITLPFSSFITMMGDGLDLITDIIYNFPSAIVAFALAIISATIVFGVIKVLKEH